MIRAAGGGANGTAGISGGTINGTTIGATTPSTGAFTTLSASTSITGPGAIRSSAGSFSIQESGGGTYAQFVTVGSPAALTLYATPAGSPTGPVVLTADASDVLALKNGNTAQEWRVYAGNGCYSGIITVNESLTIAAAATTDSATTIPINAVILSVAVRVTTVIPTAATFTVTTATGGTTMNTAAVSTAANSTDVGTKGGHFFQSAATKVRITPNLTPGAATGVVRLCIAYYLPTAPTS